VTNEKLQNLQPGRAACVTCLRGEVQAAHV
jgi:hypothetical protein